MFRWLPPRHRGSIEDTGELDISSFGNSCHLHVASQCWRSGLGGVVGVHGQGEGASSVDGHDGGGL